MYNHPIAKIISKLVTKKNYKYVYPLFKKLPPYFAMHILAAYHKRSTFNRQEFKTFAEDYCEYAVKEKIKWIKSHPEEWARIRKESKDKLDSFN